MDPLYKDMLDRQNALRATHHAPTLVWDATLAASASTWTWRCGTLYDSTNTKYGENVFIKPTANSPTKDIEYITSRWINEVRQRQCTSAAAGGGSCLPHALAGATAHAPGQSQWQLHGARGRTGIPHRSRGGPTAQGFKYNHTVEPSQDAKKQVRAFTQIVWKATTRVGCHIKTKCYDSSMVFAKMVCRYDTPGNIDGQYLANVLAP
jgi:hypothetical protein